MEFIGFSDELNVRRERKKGVEADLMVFGLTTWKGAAANNQERASQGQ